MIQSTLFAKAPGSARTRYGVLSMPRVSGHRRQQGRSRFWPARCAWRRPLRQKFRLKLTMVRDSALNGMRWVRKRLKLRRVPWTPGPLGRLWTAYTPPRSSSAIGRTCQGFSSRMCRRCRMRSACPSYRSKDCSVRPRLGSSHLRVLRTTTRRSSGSKLPYCAQ